MYILLKSLAIATSPRIWDEEPAHLLLWRLLPNSTHEEAVAHLFLWRRKLNFRTVAPTLQVSTSSLELADVYVLNSLCN